MGPPVTITGFLDQTISGVGLDAPNTCSAGGLRCSSPYQVYVPRGYSADREWPLVLFLHGAGEGGDDGLLPTEFQLGSAIRRHADLFEAIAVFPQQRPASYWSQADLAMAMVCLEQACRTWRIDRRRLLLCGVSSGATGAWNLAVREPSRFAGLLIVGGLVGPSPAVPASEAVVSAEVEDPHRWLAQRLRQLPIWIHHGDGDPLFPVHDARRTAAALRAEGATISYSELPGFGHNVWDTAFYSEEVLRWLLNQKRPVQEHLGPRLP